MKYASMLNNLVFAYIKMRQEEENWHTKESIYIFLSLSFVFSESESYIPKAGLELLFPLPPKCWNPRRAAGICSSERHSGKEPTVEHRQESWRHLVVSISHVCSGLPNGWLRVWDSTCLAGAKRATPQQRKEYPRERQSKYSQKPVLVGTA